MSFNPVSTSTSAATAAASATTPITAALSEADLKMGKVANITEADDMRIRNIAEQILLGKFKEAEAIFNQLPNNTLKEKLEKIIFIPLHKYLRCDFNLICHYKVLRILELIGDEKAKETLKAWHWVNHLVNALGNSTPNVSKGIENYINPSHTRTPADISNGTSPVFYVNLDSSINMTKVENSDGTVDLEIREAFGTASCKVPFSKETKFFILFFLGNGFSKIMLEGRWIDSKLNVTSFNISKVPDLSGSEKARWSLQKYDEIGFTKAVERAVTSFNGNDVDFDEKGVNSIIHALSNYTRLYQHKDGSIFTSFRIPETMTYIPDFFKLGGHSGRIDFYATTLRSSFFLGWKSVAGTLSCLYETDYDAPYAYADNFLFDITSKFDPNTLRYRCSQSTIVVSGNGTRPFKSERINPFLSVATSQPQPFSMEFQRNRNWHDVAIFCMEMACSKDFGVKESAFELGSKK